MRNMLILSALLFVTATGADAQRSAGESAYNWPLIISDTCGTGCVLSISTPQPPLPILEVGKGGKLCGPAVVRNEHGVEMLRVPAGECVGEQK